MTERASRGLRPLAAALAVAGLLAACAPGVEEPGVVAPDGSVPVGVRTETGGGTDDDASRTLPVDDAAWQQARASVALDPCPVADPDVAPVPQGLPDLVLPCLDEGADVRLAGLRGTPVLVNVWAQWCGPCREEVPALQELHERADGRLLVLGVDYNDDPAYALRFAGEHGMTYPSLVDHDKELRGPLAIPGQPLTLLYDAEGRLVHRQHTPLDSYEEFAALVREHLGVRL